MLNQFLLGDCFDWISKIEDNSVDLILIDPPYLISKKSYFKNYSEEASDKMIIKYSNVSIDFGEWDKQEIDFDTLFKEYNRILKTGGTLIIFFDIWKSNLLKELADKYKFKQHRVCQWVKNNPTPINSKVNYLSNAVEYFFTFVKGKNPTFNSSYDKGIYNFPLCHGRERTNHPTQKPLELFKSLIEKHTNSGDLVLDTFGGSATTAVACIETGRNYTVIERDETYYEIGTKRLYETNNNNRGEQ
jgi:site-specific DNA-methyltransferase (adenine-specific)